MKDSQLISIIIPNYNSGVYLERALNSIYEQDYPYWEVIIVDNNSTDESKELIDQIENKKVTILNIDNNGIIAASRNLGIEYSRGKWIAFLDADDWWLPNKLSLVSAYFKDFDIIYHNMYIVERHENIHRRKTRCRPLKNLPFQDLLYSGNTLVTSSVVLRKSLFYEVGLFSECYVYRAWEDYDAWLRLAKKAARFKLIKCSLGYFWQVGESTLTTKLQQLNIIKFKMTYNDVLSSDQKYKLWWSNYTMAICNCKLSRYDLAFRYAVKATYNSNSFPELLRSIIYILRTVRLWRNN